MKEELLRYTCDMCNNTITVPMHSYITPLHSKWIEMYILLKPTDIQKTKLHFCGINCIKEYLEVSDWENR